MENRKLTRSNNKMIAGVCAGIAEYFGWDTSVVRIVYVIATFFTAFCGIPVYLILWIIMPQQMPSQGYEDRLNDRLNNR